MINRTENKKTTNCIVNLEHSKTRKMRKQRGPPEKTQCKWDKGPTNRVTIREKSCITRPTADRAPTEEICLLPSYNQRCTSHTINSKHHTSCYYWTHRWTVQQSIILPYISFQNYFSTPLLSLVRIWLSLVPF